MDELPGIHSHQIREKSRLSSGVCAHIALGGCPGPWAAAPWRCVQGNPWISWLPVHGSVCGRGERPESAPAVPTAPTGVCEPATFMSGFPVSNLASPRSLSPYVHIASAAWCRKASGYLRKVCPQGFKAATLGLNGMDGIWGPGGRVSEPRPAPPPHPTPTARSWPACVMGDLWPAGPSCWGGWGSCSRLSGTCVRDTSHGMAPVQLFPLGVKGAIMLPGWEPIQAKERLQAPHPPRTHPATAEAQSPALSV